MSLNSSDLAAAQRLPLFENMSAATGARLFRTATVHHFAPGSVLFREGEVAGHLHVLLDGYVGLKTSDNYSNEYVVEFVNPGDPFVVAAVLLQVPYLSSAQVIKSSRVLLISADDFRKAVDADLSLSGALNRTLSMHWRVLMDQVKSLKTRTATERLASFLVSLADRPKGETSVLLPCERRMLAGWLGMVPTSASRAFRQLEKLGVEGRGRRLTIKSVERLREFSHTA
jgi:CRP/FNR family transcriptional regulator, transcriptional activator FtrB